MKSFSLPALMLLISFFAACAVNALEPTTPNNAANVNSRPFITTWNTEWGISLTTNDNYTYNFTIDWGDGTIDKNQTGDVWHVYDVPGIHTVSITGVFPHLIQGPSTDARKLLTIEQWGDIEWHSMKDSFSFTQNMVNNATDIPNLSSVTDTSHMFYQAKLFTGDLSGWDVSNVTNMSNMFDSAAVFNSDISNWDVSNVTNMRAMFNRATTFNQNIGFWDVSSVTDMASMFCAALNFNQDIGSWDVSSVIDMGFMFQAAEAFNQNLNYWDVSNVTLMRYMFSYASAFNEEIGDWDMSNVISIRSMFSHATTFNQPIGNWDLGSVIDMRHMFVAAHAFNQPIGGWDVRGVSSMSNVFEQAKNFNQDLSLWDVKNVNSMYRMFLQAEAFNQDLSQWDVSSVMYMGEILKSTNFSTAHYDTLLVNWSHLNLQNNVEFSVGDTMYTRSNYGDRQSIIDNFAWNIEDGGEKGSSRAFITTWKTTNSGISDNKTISIKTDNNYSYDFSIDWGDGTLEKNQTTNVRHTYATKGTYTISIKGEFPRLVHGKNTDAAKLLTIEQWGDIKWYSMQNSFWHCRNLTSNAQDIPDLRLVTSTRNMFFNAHSFNADINEWDMSNVSIMINMFRNARNFNQNIADWDVSSVTLMNQMFNGAKRFNQDISDWDVSRVRNMKNMLNNVDLSTANYDALLNGWSKLNLTNNVTLGAGQNQYSPASETARSELINNLNWEIKDAGLAE